MLTEGERSSSAAFAVGYESVSQFTREYGRMFGLPPIKDAKAARQKALAARSCVAGGGVACPFACSSPTRLVTLPHSHQLTFPWLTAGFFLACFTGKSGPNGLYARGALNGRV